MAMPASTIPQTLALAIGHHQAGRLGQAQALYRQILAAQPDHADALHLLGLLAHQAGRGEMAVELIQRAIAIAPGEANYHYNLGNVMQGQGQAAEALACYRKAVSLSPGHAEAWNNLGNALRGRGEVDEAIECFERALAAKGDFADAHYNLGNTLRKAGRLDEAIASYQRALALSASAAAMSNLGSALHDVGQLGQAIACYQSAMRLEPGAVSAHSSLVFSLQYHPDYDAAAIYGEHRLWNQQHAEPLEKFIRPHRNERSAERRLRIGYVSPDFRDHVVGRNLMPLFAHHDHQRFEIFCYANVARPDGLTARFGEYSDHWRDILGISDQDAAEMIRNDGIDVLVDLALHTAGNRLLVLARKPAPVQVTFAGYPGTTGLRTIDYRLTDPYLDPPGTDESCYSEKPFRLPHSFWCFEPPADEVAVNELPAAQAGQVTFGCLGNYRKVNDSTLRLWAAVLRAVPESKLVLLAPEGSHRQSCLDLFAAEGIDSSRIEFVARCARAAYLELYHRIDIGLDTLPYNGHTTSLDSLWMGVPVITLVGKTAVGRAGLSQLTNLGLPELIARDATEFVRIAAGLAGDLPRLGALRSSLRQRMQASPLMDAVGFARGIESAYRAMWRQWCA